MSGNDFLRPKKPRCEGSYQAPANSWRGGHGVSLSEGTCCTCGGYYTLWKGRIPRHAPAAPREEVPA